MNQLQRTEALQRHLRGETMTHSERFALNQWLTRYPEDMSYAEVLDGLRDYREADYLSIWALADYIPAFSVLEIIEDTRKAFERAVDQILKGKQ